MIEITCTAAEKRKIIKALSVMETPCLFPRAAHFCAFNPAYNCETCLNTRIKWNLRPARKTAGKRKGG